MEKIHVFGVDFGTWNLELYAEVVAKYKQYEVSGGCMVGPDFRDVQFEFPYVEKETAVALYNLLENFVHEDLHEYVSIYALDEDGIQLDTDEV